MADAKQPVLQQGFVTEDGKVFGTRAEAIDYLRRPQITEALLKVTDKNQDLTDWLIENTDEVVAAFDTGTIRRVSKSDKNKLDKAVDHLVETYGDGLHGDKKLAFLVENAQAIKDSFRWPKVARMTDEEKAVAAKNTLVALSGNEEVADWLLANKDAVLEAFEAGKVKREVNPAAQEALAAYREKKAAEKAAKEAAGGEAADTPTETGQSEG